MPWWAWPLILFIVTFLMGIVAVLGGVGGGVLFVPIIGGFFPFHIDFVRGAGLLVALAGALAAGPGLLKKGMADLRLALPVALIASSCAIVGAMIGLALPAKVVNIALGGTILGIVAIMPFLLGLILSAFNLGAAASQTGIFLVSSSGLLIVVGVVRDTFMNIDAELKLHGYQDSLLVR